MNITEILLFLASLLSLVWTVLFVVQSFLWERGLCDATSALRVLAPWTWSR